ncbi:acyl carrier protein [uncultured Sphingobacterium sp.]|uniref:acyl carrier protein n=1 Tax=uncultured Sphingobacterium sp. TaxID=182688 RepID=UPI0025E1BE6F|nr:acyl carrier protein [uncultured Sphingobacterium sp.]
MKIKVNLLVASSLVVFAFSCSKNEYYEKEFARIENEKKISLKAGQSKPDFFGVANKIRNEIAIISGKNAEDVLLESHLVNDLGLVDLDLEDVFIFCEREFDIEFEDQEKDKISTVNDLVNFCYKTVLETVDVYPPGTDPQYPYPWNPDPQDPQDPQNPQNPQNPGYGGIDPNPNFAKIKEHLKDKPFALIPNIPCDIIKKWIATAKFTVDQSTLWRIKYVENVIKPGNDNSYLINVQNINSAYSSVVNMDYFPITINKMPKINGQILTPDQFLEYIRKDINKFVDTKYSEFEPYRYSGVDDTNLWNSGNPKNAIVSIDIKGPDNASVIVSNYSNTGWTFTTIYEPKYGQHPVSGNRDFGYVKNQNGSYTFYTRGVDRLTTVDAVILGKASEFFTGKAYPFQQADALWTSFQKITTDFVNKNGGNAGIAQQEIHRPDWSLVKDVIDGKRPLSSLSTDCKN